MTHDGEIGIEQWDSNPYSLGEIGDDISRRATRNTMNNRILFNRPERIRVDVQKIDEVEK